MDVKQPIMETDGTQYEKDFIDDQTLFHDTLKLPFISGTSMPWMVFK